MNKILLFGLALCGSGVAMLITGLLPKEKMNRVRTRMGDPNKPTDRGQARMQLYCLWDILFNHRGYHGESNASVKAKLW